MPYILREDRLRFKDSLKKLVEYINKAESAEEAFYLVVSQILQRYICCGYRCRHSGSPAPPPECDPLVEEAIIALSLVDDDAIEKTLAYYTGSLLELTLCTVIDYVFVSRSIGALQRIAKVLCHREYWGIEAIRQSRVLGVLRCIEFELYRYAFPGLDCQFSMERSLDF